MPLSELGATDPDEGNASARPGIQQDGWTRAATAGAIGHDPSGSVGIEIDKARAARRLILRENWRKKIDPQELAGSILLAYSDAILRQMEATCRGAPTTEHSGGFNLSELRTYWGTPVRTTQNYLSDVTAAVQRIERSEAMYPDTTLDHPLSARIRLTVRSGLLVDCWINPTWVSARTAAQIMNEFVHTLESDDVKTSDRAAADLDEALAELQSLAMEAVGALSSMRRGLATQLGVSIGSGHRHG